MIEDDLKLNVYRIIQEHLNKILKHAAANVIPAVINADHNNTIQLVITDNEKE